MKQFPNELKFKKYHKANYSFNYLKDRKNFFLNKGMYGLQALSSGKLTFRHIEACRRSIRRGLKKKGDIFIRPFTSVPVSRKAVASRMGKVRVLYHFG